MILPTTELFSSLQSAITEGGSKSLELGLMTGDAQSHPAQNFDATLDETLSNEHQLSVEKESDNELKPAESNLNDSVRLARPTTQVYHDQSSNVQAESKEVDAQLDLNNQPVRQAVKLEMGNLLHVKSSSTDATALDKAHVSTTERTAQISKQEKAVQASFESPMRPWPSGEKLTQASDAGPEGHALRVEGKSMESEQKIGQTARSQDHLMQKVQSKQASDLDDLIQKKQTLSSLKSPLETNHASNSGAIADRHHLLRGQHSQNDLTVPRTQQKAKEPGDLVIRSVERAPALSNSNLMSDTGDALSAIRHNSDFHDHQSDLNGREPSQTSKPLQMSKRPMDAVISDLASDGERSKVERSGELGRQSNHKELTEASNRQKSQSVSSSINFEGRSSVVAKDGQELVSKGAGAIMPANTDARQLEGSGGVQKVDVDKHMEKLIQHANQFKVQLSTADQSRLTSSATSPVHELALSERQQKYLNRSQRKTENLAVRTALQASSESVHPISDSRQTYISLPSRLGQATKTDVSILDQSLLQDSKRVKDWTGGVSDKASRDEAKFDKQAQAGGFLESNHLQSVTTNKGNTGTLNQSSPVLMQRMLDTIQELKQSQNAQRVSFELDLAQGEKLKVRLQLSGDQVKSVFTTDSNTMKHLIRENWDQLQRQVEAEGFDLAQPDFTDRNPQQAEDADDRSPNNEFFQAESKSSGSLENSTENKSGDLDSRDLAHDDEHSEVVRYA